MSSLDLEAAEGAESPRAGLELLRLPFVFSQVGVLGVDAFRRAAREWGLNVSASQLHSVRRAGLLVPLFAVVEDADSSKTILVDEADQDRIARYARAGTLRAPDDATVDAGSEYFYSRWQLLGLRDALRVLENRRICPNAPTGSDEAFADRAREEHLALAALASRFYPQIVGQVSFPSFADQDSVRRAARDLTAERRLEVVGLPTGRLRPAGEFLLDRARNHDPLAEWWDVIRHSNHLGWFKLRGRALESVWQRIAAEVLLRAEEELASETGDPIPSANGPRLRQALTDRIGHTSPSGLPVALTRMALSPQPRVVLVLEGDVEMFHVRAILDAIELGHRVRLVNQGTSSDSPTELASFVAPRLAQANGRRAIIEGAPTSLVVAMDNEGEFRESNGAFDRTVSNLRQKVRDQVSGQGAAVSEEELDSLVDVRTWGEQKYELANFSDEELAVGLARVGLTHGDSAEREEDLRELLISHLEHVRNRELDVKVVYQRMQWPVRKMDLARELLSALTSRIGQAATYDELPPVLKLVEDVRVLVNHNSLGAFGLNVAQHEDIATNEEQPRP
ncbi:hypothetical protein GCM10027515_19900 [Schumannella luteola]|uniref:Uncharacterized protein n=1 Tax=Schumannella luteola TaxID=472059 RepID=A0A852YFZ4_9MICO|nr:hypothetical protein [Schumannella luteola]NYH00215.1 hypothetical protein [Schumannella luteola]TPX04036.1 hypothetical protein FJ656_13620 [Schumannella luteola]